MNKITNETRCVLWRNMEMKKEERSYSKYLHKFETELDKFEDNLKKGFEENDLLQIDIIRSFALENRSVLPESIPLLEKANSILLAHYQNDLNIQIEKMKRGANKDMIMEFSRLRYIICRLEDNKNLKQLEDEGREYAREIISAGNRLAVILGVDPLE